MTREEAKKEALTKSVNKGWEGMSVVPLGRVYSLLDKIFDEMPKPVHEFEAEAGLAFDDDVSYYAEELGVDGMGYIEAEVDTFKRGKKYIIKIYEVEDEK